MSAVPTYAPRPGGVPERALAYLRDDLPKGGEISNAALAEALRVGSQVLAACLQPARAAGVVFARQKGGHARSPLFWSLVDHASNGAAPRGTVMGLAVASEAAPPAKIAVPAVRLEDGEQPHDAEPPEAAPAVADASIPAGAPALATLPHHSSPVGGPMGARQPAAAGPAGGLRIALWSDGTLEIQRGGDPVIRLPREQTRQLVEYLDSIALDLVREGGE